jgi:hypothetical protein
MKSKKIPDSFQGVPWSANYWVNLVGYFRSRKMPDSLIGNALLAVPALASPALGYPLFAELKSREPWKIAKFLYQCSEIVPIRWIIDTSRTAMRIRDVEVLSGKMILSWNKGLSVKELDLIYSAYLNSDSLTGYIGPLPKTDPRRGSPDVLTIDLDEDQSEPVRLITGEVPESNQPWEPEVQAALLTTAIMKVKGANGSFDTRFLKRQWSSVDSPMKDLSIKVYSLVGKLTGIFVQGTPIAPKARRKKTPYTTEDMTYILGSALLDKSLNFQSLTAGCLSGEIDVLEALKAEEEGGKGKNGVTVARLLETTKSSQASVYRHMSNLAEKCLIQVKFQKSGRKCERLYSLNYDTSEEFPDFRLPTMGDWQDYQEETLNKEKEEEAAVAEEKRRKLEKKRKKKEEKMAAAKKKQAVDKKVESDSSKTESQAANDPEENETPQGNNN